MFWSQELTKQTIDNLCVRCETRFDKWTDYHAHVTDAKCSKKIKPINTSGRTFTQIVKDWESNQKEGTFIQ